IERARVKMEQIKPRSTLPRGKKEGGLTVKLFKGHYTSLPPGRGKEYEGIREVRNATGTSAKTTQVAGLMRQREGCVPRRPVPLDTSIYTSPSLKPGSLYGLVLLSPPITQYANVLRLSRVG
ncbi:MAG: hypothetical protein ACREYE_08045, partial [Gammaproteobacteria bacterium]